MTGEHLLDLYLAKQLQPFTLQLTDGRQVVVKSPEFTSFSASGRTVVVYEPEDRLRIVDRWLVTEAHVFRNDEPVRTAAEGDGGKAEQAFAIEISWFSLALCVAI